jgi:hypothetical protein
MRGKFFLKVGKSTSVPSAIRGILDSGGLTPSLIHLSNATSNARHNSRTAFGVGPARNEIDAKRRVDFGVRFPFDIGMEKGSGPRPIISRGVDDHELWQKVRISRPLERIPFFAGNWIILLNGQ